MLQLKQLYLGERSGGEGTVSREMELKTRVCGTVLTGYDMSLRDSMQLASAKLEQSSALIGQLGGEVPEGGEEVGKKEEDGTTLTAVEPSPQ